MTAVPAAITGAPRLRTAAVATIVCPPKDWPAESVSRPRSVALRPKGIFTRPERTLRKRRPTFALVAVSRTGLPCATLPALSLTVTRMSILDALPRSSVARSRPFFNVALSVRYASVEFRRTSSVAPAIPDALSLTESTIVRRRARSSNTRGALPSTLIVRAIAVSFPDVSVATMRAACDPSGVPSGIRSPATRRV